MNRKPLRRLNQQIPPGSSRVLITSYRNNNERIVSQLPGRSPGARSRGRPEGARAAHGDGALWWRVQGLDGQRG